MNSFAFRRRPGGFTLLELLVVVVVIGILASLALVKFGNVQERAYVATMQSDLRNFATARALHVAEENAAPTQVSDVTGFRFSEAVFEAGYQDAGTEWALLVGHNKSATRCSITEQGSQATRTSCGESEGLAFSAEGTTNEREVTVDASSAVSGFSFVGETSVLAALAAGGGKVSLVSWDWGDGTRSSGSPATHTKQRHVYEKAGSYTITLTLVGEQGKTVTGGQVVEVKALPAPLVVLDDRDVMAWGLNSSMQRISGNQIRFANSGQNISRSFTLPSTDYLTGAGKEVTLAAGMELHQITTSTPTYNYTMSFRVGAASANMVGKTLNVGVSNAGDGWMSLSIGTWGGFSGAVAGTAYEANWNSAIDIEFVKVEARKK